MTLSISPRQESSSSNQIKFFKTLDKKRGLSSGFAHWGPTHSSTEFTPSPKQEKNKKAVSTSPLRPVSDDRLMMSMVTQRDGEMECYRAQGCNHN